MTETLAKWLNDQMRKRALNQSQVAAYLNVKPATVNRWAAGKTTPNPESCAKLAQLFDEPVEKVYRLAGHPTTYEPLPERTRSFQEVGMEFLNTLPIKVPVYEQAVSAGPGREIREYVYLDRSSATDGRFIAIRVDGISMEPEIGDGDTIIVDKERSPMEGDIVVANLDGQFFVKHFVMKRGRPVLRGNNGDMAAEGAEIEGVVIQSIKNLARR